MRAVIIDDEASVRESTQTLLSIYCPDIEVIGQASGVKEGIALIQEKKPDLAFLDVEMSDGTGFDVVYSFKDRDFAIVFVTGHNEYAVKAFRLSAIDYILKPIDPEDLEKAVAKARQNFQATLAGLQMKALESNLSESRPQRILLKDSEKIYLIDIKDIVRCESDDNYTRFYLTKNRKVMVSTTLKEYENMLSGQDFFRCHQSHLINLNYFDHYDKH